MQDVHFFKARPVNNYLQKIYFIVFSRFAL